MIDFVVKRKYNVINTQERLKIIMAQENTNLRVCKKCLTRDMIGKEEYFRSMREYIDNLDIDVKAPDELYEKRLAACRECDFLLEGMCRKCGCYVEMRAAVIRNSCPGTMW